MTPDDAAPDASDAIGAWRAANSAPAWPVLPDGVRPQDFTEVWSGILTHDPASGETTARFSARTEPVEVTYVTAADVEAWYDALTDRQRQAVDQGAASVAAATGVSAEWLRDAFIRHLALKGNADG